MIPSHKDLLKSHDLSVTPVRLAVLRALEMHPHADAEKIFSVVQKQITTTSKQAIYNNLNALVTCGLLREIKPKGQSFLYETRVGDNHHHLVCKKCQLVMDTDCMEAAPCLKPKHKHGFAIEEAEIIFWGLCPACQKTSSKKGKQS